MSICVLQLFESELKILKKTFCHIRVLIHTRFVFLLSGCYNSYFITIELLLNCSTYFCKLTAHNCLVLFCFVLGMNCTTIELVESGNRSLSTT